MAVQEIAHVVILEKPFYLCRSLTLIEWLISYQLYLSNLGIALFWLR